MKIALWSDLHLHSWRSFGVDPVTLVSKRLQDQIRVTDQIYKIIKGRKVELAIDGGDGLHLRGLIPTEALNVANKFYKKVRDCCIELLILRGNHCNMSDTVYSKLHDSLQFTEFDPEKEYTKEYICNEVSVKCIDYHSSILEEDIRGYDVVVLHKQPTMVTHYGHKLEGVDWKKLASQNKFVFFGHYHIPTKLSDNCYILGSPMELEFGDNTDRGMYILDTSSGVVEFIKLDYPKFLTVKEPSEVVDSKNYYRVLNAKERILRDNVVLVSVPEFFEERLHSSDFRGIISEWMRLNNKSEESFKVVEDIVNKRLDIYHTVYKGQLRRVFIQDFISFKEEEFTIKDGFTIIVGDNGIGGSNGSGKSTLFEAILWCLFNTTSKGLTGNDVVRRGSENCKVSLEFIYGDEITIISRSRKEGLAISVGGKELCVGFKENQKQQILEKDILGFDQTMFLTSCYFSQENCTMFMELSDFTTTNMITHLLGFEVYDDILQEIKGKYDSIIGEIGLIDTKADKIKYDIDKCQIRIESSKKNVLALTDRQESYIEEVKGLTKSIEMVNSDRAEIAKELDAEIPIDESINKRVNELTDKIAVKSKELSIERLRVKDCNDRILLLSDKVNEVVSLLKRSRRDTERLLKEIEELENLTFGERCNKCGAEITESNVVLFIQDKRDKLSSLNRATEELAFIEKERITALTEAKNVNTSCDECIKLLEKEIESYRNELNEALSNREHEQKRKADLIVKYELLGSKIESYKDQVAKTKLRVLDLDRDIQVETLEIAKLNELIKKFDSEIDTLSTERLRKTSLLGELAFWSDSFSYKGIRALLLDKFCNEFNSLVNSFLSVISSGRMSVVFSPTKVLKSGEERNKLGIDIKLGSERVKYKSLSGGEKRRVDVAVCLALNSWVSVRNNIPKGLLGFIAFDELFSFIDRLGEEEIGVLFSAQGKNKALFVISHTSELSSYADNQWLVEKKNGISNLITITR